MVKKSEKTRGSIWVFLDLVSMPMGNLEIPWGCLKEDGSVQVTMVEPVMRTEKKIVVMK